MDKIKWRESMKRTRDELDADFRRSASEAISHYLMNLEAWRKAKRVLLYLSFGSEYDTEGLIQAAWQEKKTVLLPICLPERQLGPARYEPSTPLVRTSFGLREIPRESQEFMSVENLDFCLIPGLIFDRYGGRIGYGGGYYDRFLPRLPNTCFAIASAFSPQIVSERLPLEPFDYRIPRLCSEKGFEPLTLT